MSFTAPKLSYALASKDGDTSSFPFFKTNEIDFVTPMPDFYEDGAYRMINIREGSDISIITHGTMKEPLVVGASFPSRLKISYALDIPANSRLWIDGTLRRLPVGRGTYWLISPNCVPQFEYFAPKSAHIVLLSIDRTQIIELTEVHELKLSGDILQVITEPRGEPSLAISTIDMEISRMLEQIETCPYHGAIEQLFLEGLSLSLTAVSLQRFMSIEPLPFRNGSLSTREKRRMMEARDILDARWRETPSLGELSKELGISVSKLKRDFRRTQKSSVHEYIIQKRMDEAQRLLVEGVLSVKEASYFVGYKSQSYFSRAFKQYYGHLPSQHKQ
jgi:AraC-like DNA-binding protein